MCRMNKSVYVTGWDREGNLIDDCAIVRDNESPEQAIERLINDNDVVEVGDIVVTGGE